MEEKIRKLREAIKSNADLNKKYADIAFLVLKVDHLKKKINEGYASYIQYINEEQMKDLKSKGTLNNIKKSNCDEIILQSSFSKASGNCPLFYDLDTFLIDIRRIVEFALKFTKLNMGFGEKDFKVDVFLNQLEESYKQQKSNFVLRLEQEHKWFVEFINHNREWLQKISAFRTESIHYSVLNEVGPFNIEFKWNTMQSLEETPQQTNPTLTYLGTPMLDFVKGHFSKISFFVEQIFRLNLEIIEKKAK